MNFISKLSGVFVLVAIWGLSSCTVPISAIANTGLTTFGYLDGVPKTYAYYEPKNPNEKGAFWDGDGIKGKSRVRINLREQKVYFYKANHLVGISPISTGKEGHSTSPGRFKIVQKSAKHRSSLYGIIRDKKTGRVINADADSRIDKPKPGQVYEGVPMPYFMRFDGGIGMHQGYLPGFPASHGCVRMPMWIAKKFYQNLSIGSEVIVE